MDSLLDEIKKTLSRGWMVSFEPYVHSDGVVIKVSTTLELQPRSKSYMLHEVNADYVIQALKLLNDKLTEEVTKPTL